LFGTPPDHKEEKKEHEIVEAPEFDVTQYAKKLAVVLGVLAPAIVGLLKVLNVKVATAPIAIGALGVTAAALIGVSLVMAVDIAARAYLTVGKAKEEAAKDSQPTGELVTAAPGTMVWLEGDNEPHPLLAISGDGTDSSSYLVATGPTIERSGGGKDMSAVDGPPAWHPASDVRAIRPRKWP
jgi:hypothetical protein